MQQQDKIYVIRHLSFWYTDEWYQSFADHTHHAGHITDLFDHKDDAIQKWKQLEYDFSHYVNFENIIYCEYSHGEFNGKQDILAQKSVDELFTIIQELECHVYGLYEYPKELKQQVLFNTKSQQYDLTDCCTDYDVNSNTFINANFPKNYPLIHQISPPIDDAFEHIIELKGSLEELSDTPLLLQRLIEENPDIQYYQPYLELKVKFKDLPQVNALLKQPIEKELRNLTIEEIYQLEKQLNLSHSPSQISTNAKEPLFAIWLFNEEKYYSESKYGHCEILTYTNPEYFALRGIYILQDELFISGSLQDLSHSPELLKVFIQNDAYYSFEYQINPTGILITSPDVDFEDLSAFNSLLKQPLFEIRQVTLEELNHLTEDNQS